MKKLGFSALALCASTAFAKPTVYQIDTVVDRQGKSEALTLILEAEQTGSISSINQKTKNGLTVEMKAEPVDEDTVFLKYVVKDVQKGTEKVISSSETMVFLDQKSDVGLSEKASDPKMAVTVQEKKVE